MYLYFPVAAVAGVTQTDNGLQFTWGASGITITFSIAGATDLGGWTIQTQPIYATTDVVSGILPLQTVRGSYIHVAPGC
jgi:alpha-D-ribose 1-methylphosphonate 5-phosphate C-P lyase